MSKSTENLNFSQNLTWEARMLIKESIIKNNNIRIKKLEKQVNKLLS